MYRSEMAWNTWSTFIGWAKMNFSAAPAGAVAPPTAIAAAAMAGSNVLRSDLRIALSFFRHGLSARYPRERLSRGN